MANGTGVGPGRIPGSVWVAAAALVVAIVTQTLLVVGQAEGLRPDWMRMAFAALLAVLVLGGILGRRRLAWLWGHHLALFLAALTALQLGAHLWTGHPVFHRTTLLLSLSLLALGAAFGALERRSAVGYFDLICPSCLSVSRFGNDFLFRQARCRKCQNVW
jgi:hypothetical protein